MHRNTWMALAFIMAVSALVATPAKAAGNYWESDQQDESMCQDMTGNWVMCDSMGGDGISGGGGVAPGMDSCTSTKGCMTCAVPTKSLSGKDECATVRYQDGYCKCGYNGQGGCSLSGACTYVGG